MNNKILIVIIIIVLLVGVGGYYFLSSRNTSSTGQGYNMENMSSKPVVQSHRSYELDATSNTENVLPNQPTTFSFRVKNDKGEVLKNYEVVHEKIMHFIVVRKDLQNFQHIHPDFNQSTGEFTVSVTFPTDGPYRVFPDFTPGEENPQKLPVTLNKDINVGDMSKYNPQQAAVDTNPTKTVGGYAITYTLDPQLPKTQSNFTFTLTVSRNGQPVTNLETYLGAMGHSVILKEGTLDFIHAHAVDMNMSMPGMDNGAMMMESPSSNMGPDINFSTTFPESGIYKIFTQFQHQGKVMTVDYTIKVN